MRNILLSCMLLLTAGIASAQNFAITFTTKTPFTVASSTLPAGSYTIRMLDGDDYTFECTNSSNDHSVMFEADRHEVTPTTTDVTFSKYGDKLVMKNISIAGDASYWIPISTPEKRVKKTGATPTKVTTTATKKTS
jgi:hypothetical protein